MSAFMFGVFSGSWLTIYCWWDLAQPPARVLHLEHDVKDVAVDFPRRAAENVKACIYKFHVTERRCVLEVCLLFLTSLKRIAAAGKFVSQQLIQHGQCILTSVVEIPALVIAEPWLGLDEHGQMTRVESFMQTVLCDAFRDHRVQLDDTKLLPADIFICMVECRLILFAVQSSQ